jgi:uncharacterized membrane protein
MKILFHPFLKNANRAFLVACCSMYFGTGWSLLLFSFPISDQLTPDNYYLQIVPQFTAATAFFTTMTQAMLTSCLLWVWHEWKTAYRWLAILVLLAIIAPTAVTLQFLFPLNKLMKSGITDAVQFKEVLANWMFWNKVRVSLWTIQWLGMIFYFALRLFRIERTESVGTIK